MYSFIVFVQNRIVNNEMSSLNTCILHMPEIFLIQGPRK